MGDMGMKIGMHQIVCGLILASTSAWAQTPVIAAGGIENAASQTPPSLPGGSIAPGSLFLVYLSNLLPVKSSAATTYPLTAAFNGVSMTVTVNGTQEPVLMYATIPLAVYGSTLLEGVLPSATPVGTGTITATYNGQTSATAPIVVAASSFGWYTNYPAGSGPGAFTDSSSFKRITPTNSAHPGEEVTGWGTGLGAASASTDASGGGFAVNPSGLALWIGGQQVTPDYTGRSSSAAEDQINFKIPAGVTGCAVPLVLQVGSIVSNTVTIPIAASGSSVCNDPNGFASTDLQTLVANGSLRYGTIVLQRSSSPLALLTGLPPVNSTTDGGYAYFYKVSTGNILTSLGPFQYPTIGTCSVFTFVGSSASVPVDPTLLTGLDAGPSMSVVGPGASGTQVMSEESKGQYYGDLSPTGTFLNAGAFNINNGSGGADIGPISAGPVTIPAALVWSNQSNISTVTRSQGLTVTWTGGDPNGAALIIGFAIQSTPEVGAKFICTAPTKAGQFTVPPSVLLALPASTGSGELAVGGVTAPVTFIAPGVGLDTGYAVSVASSSQSVTYQ
jgi:uncharacterized protein (TIGR03437 family)